MKNLSELKSLLEKTLPWELVEMGDVLDLKSVNGVIFGWRTKGEQISFSLTGTVNVSIKCNLDEQESRQKSFSLDSPNLTRDINSFVMR